MRFLELQEQNEQLWEYTQSVMASSSVKAVVLAYSDNAGISRVKTIPARRLRNASRFGVGMSPVFDAFLFDDSITSSEFSGGPMGELRLLPDLSELRVLDETSGWAYVPVERFRQNLEPHPLCHRRYARDSYLALQRQNVTSKMAFEIEWVVSTDPGSEFTPACTGPAYSLDRVGELEEYLMDLYSALLFQRVAVEQIHPEYAPGQFEVSIEATDPIRAADLCVLVMHSIKRVSKKHGLKVSFAPVVTSGGVGNGGHLHFSLQKDGRPIFRALPEEVHELSAEGRSVIAGILKELPALCALGASSPASYLRLVPHRWAGAFRCWGIDNREAALRFVKQTELVKEEGANLEIKPFDLSSSPYLAVGGVLAVAGGYLNSGLQPPDPIVNDPGLLDETQRKNLDVDRLPSTLEGSLEALVGSSILSSSMGEELLTAFVAVKEAEIALTSAMSPEEIVDATRWRY